MSARAGASAAPAAAGSARRSRRAPRRRPRRSSPRSGARRRARRRAGRRPPSRRRCGSACGRSILFTTGDDLEVVLDREVGVRERLRLDSLRGVDDEQRALARLQRARDLVGEVDVAGRVDEVELVALPGDADGLRLDRDPALALELHRVEQLVAHLAARHRLGHLEDPVRERRLPVVDVGDDREVADPALVHASRRPAAPSQR